MRNTSLVVLGAAAIFSAMASPAISHEQGDWIVRVGTATVDPSESSSTITTAATGALPGTSAGLDSDTQLGLNIAYMLTDNVAVELLAATPFSHTITAKGLNQYLAVDESFNFADTKHLPPTLSVQYYFGDKTSALRPYVGVGINYTVFFEESLSGYSKANLGASNLELDDSIGLAAQAGVDYMLNDKWLINASIWHMDIDTEATFDTALGKGKVDVDIDPWAYMLSVGYKF